MNLFIVSNMGQLYQAQALIRKKHLKGNILAILYTSKNMKIYNYLVGSVDRELFFKIEPTQLPKNPNIFTKKKLDFIRNKYKNLFESYELENVFICSFESHYNFLSDLAQEFQAKLNLFEEGTATYKFLIGETSGEQEFKQRMIKALRISMNDFKRAYRNSLLHDLIKKSLIIQSLKALFKTVKRIVAALFTQKQRNLFKSKVYPDYLKTVFGTIDKFDEIYVAFPDKAEKIFKANKYHELISDYSLNEETTRLINKSAALENLDHHSIVFVNQRYNIPADLHVRIILTFLARNFLNEKIFIKFHPKDSEAMKKTFLKGVDKFNLNVEIIDLDIEVPFEAILKVKKPKMVIGISSTSLIYTEKINPETITLSCADYYINHLKDERVDQKEIDLIKYHKKILEALSDIEVK